VAQQPLHSGHPVTQDLAEGRRVSLYPDVLLARADIIYLMERDYGFGADAVLPMLFNFDVNQMTATYKMLCMKHPPRSLDFQLNHPRLAAIKSLAETYEARGLESGASVVSAELQALIEATRARRDSVVSSVNELQQPSQPPVQPSPQVLALGRSRKSPGDLSVSDDSKPLGSSGGIEFLHPEDHGTASSTVSDSKSRNFATIRGAKSTTTVSVTAPAPAATPAASTTAPTAPRTGRARSISVSDAPMQGHAITGGAQQVLWKATDEAAKKEVNFFLPS
jgi:hypothetical protein